MCDKFKIASGSIIRLRAPAGYVEATFLVENFAGKLLLAQPEQPYARLNLTTDGPVYRSSTPHGNNMFQLTVAGSNTYSLIATLKEKSDKKDLNFALALSRDGTISMVALNSDGKSKPEDCIVFGIEIEGGTSGVAGKVFGVPLFSFHKWQLRRFLSEGYLQFSGLTDSSAIEECITTINHELGIPGRIVAGGIQETESLGKLAGNLSNCSAVRNVLGGKVRAMLNAVFGVDNFESHNLSAQIALRFPELIRPSFPGDEVELGKDL